MSGKDPYPAGSVINWPSGSGIVSQDYGSADPDPKDIQDPPGPQHLKMTGLREKPPYHPSVTPSCVLGYRTVLVANNWIRFLVGTSCLEALGWNLSFLFRCVYVPYCIHFLYTLLCYR